MPVIIREPEGAPVPVVFDSPHSGNRYPDDFGAAAPLALLRAGEDAYIDDLFGAAPAQGATLIAATFPRAYIDPNRSLADLDATMLDGEWPDPLTPGIKTRRGKRS